MSAVRLSLSVGAVLVYLFSTTTAAVRLFRDYPIGIPAVGLFIVFLLWFAGRRHIRTWFLTGFALMVVAQVCLVCFIGMDYDHIEFDAGTIMRSARAWATGGTPNAYYFTRYPFNQFILYFFTGVLKVTYLMTGRAPYEVAMLANIILVDLAIWLTVKVARMFLAEGHAYVVGCLLLVSTPFYLFSPLCYSDTVSLPILMGGLLLAVRQLRRCRDGRPLLPEDLFAVCCSGLLLYAGFVMKGCPIIALTACLMELALVAPWRRMAVLVPVVFLGVFLGLLMCRGIASATGLVPAELAEKHALPLTHNIMMGLKGLGEYHREDVEFTTSFPTMAEKRAATSREIVRRVKELGCLGLLNKFREKAAFSWGYGDCGASGYIGDNDKPLRWNGLHEFLLSKGRYHCVVAALSQIVYMAVLFLTGIGFVRSCFRDDDCGLMSLRLFVVGCMCFLMVWEAHPRYSFHVRAVLIVLAGVEVIRLRNRFLAGKRIGEGVDART